MRITKAQAQTVKRLHGRFDQTVAGSLSILKFRRTVRPLFFGLGAVTVKFGGIIVAIETDGHAHS